MATNISTLFYTRPDDMAGQQEKLAQFMSELGYNRQTDVCFTPGWGNNRDKYDPQNATYWFHSQQDCEVSICPRTHASETLKIRFWWIEVVTKQDSPIDAIREHMETEID